MIPNCEVCENGALRRFFWASFAVISFAVMAVSTVYGEETNAVLTNASQVLCLPAERAILGESIRVTGVVTSAEPGWEGRFFVQDQSGGIFVENLGAAPPQPGDLVEVSGISHPGAFAPIITRPHWKKLGTAPLPPPKTVPIEQLMAGVED